ncbi:MAG: YdiU family protein [Sphingomonadales bacterium]|nr:MAG: YdiU family protein [Sphingomonadales bacterium]
MPWNFENTYFRDLAGFYAPATPNQPPAPDTVIWNSSLAKRLGLQDLAPGALAFLSGEKLPIGANPIAMAYAGHQFGHFSPQLGDGRAILLGEQIAPDGTRFDILLKGSGRTPFSRSGDGRYALGPALREHLVSEAMAALGVKTTRSLGVALTGEQVQRQTLQPGAVLARVASSHIRVGTFQFFAAHLGQEYVRRLADYTIARHYPSATEAANPYVALFEAVMEGQIRLIASWINVGFVHGVMNTDNVSISGETIDFGPCAFLDDYSSKKVFSSIDEYGRYAFGNQPVIGRWNLTQFGSSLAEVVAEVEPESVQALNAILASYPERYLAVWLEGVRAKLGLVRADDTDLELANALFAAMEGEGVDFTNLFRNLATSLIVGRELVVHMFTSPEAINAWLDKWHERLQRDPPMLPETRASAMNAVNPLYIPRNHKVEEALSAAVDGDLSLYLRLLEVVTHPYSERVEWSEYAQSAPAGSPPCVTFCGT